MQNPRKTRMSPEALIIAAGRGVRFGTDSDTRPKPLIKVAGVPLISRVLRTCRKAGIGKCTVVTGYRGGLLESFLARETEWRIRCLRNKEWRRANGVSVLRARGEVRAPFLLLMSDHLFDPRIVVKLTARPLPRGCCRLAVDFRPEKVFDIDDATKVEVRDGKIAAIGKEIANYNGVDTGIFFCTASLFTALEEARRNGRESLSDGIRELARRGRMEAADIGDLFWQDVDDPSALREAERKISKVPPSGYPEEPEGKAVRQVQANPGKGRKAP